MKRIFSLIALLALTAVSAFAQTSGLPPSPVVPPLIVQKSPPVTNQTTSLMFNAMLAISRAQLTNPAAAQTASFAYAQALEQYRRGDITGANASAINALATAGMYAVPVAMPQAPAPFIMPSVTNHPLYGASAPAIDADAFLALTRGQLIDCAARNAPQLEKAKARYNAAVKDFAAGNYQATRLDSKAAIDLCAQTQP
jgi:hypothetical protein